MNKKKAPLSHHEIHDRAQHSLEGAGLRITKPRMAILNILISRHGPFTVEEIYEHVKKAGVDRVTVYRCIENFQNAGIVRRCDFGDGPVRFEYQGVGSEHHHHIVCRRCHKVEKLKHCLAEGIEALLKKSGYHNVTHSLEFFGICAKCIAHS